MGFHGSHNAWNAQKYIKKMSTKSRGPRHVCRQQGCLGRFRTGDNLVKGSSHSLRRYRYFSRLPGLYWGLYGSLICETVKRARSGFEHVPTSQISTISISFLRSSLPRSFGIVQDWCRKCLQQLCQVSLLPTLIQNKIPRTSWFQ